MAQALTAPLLRRELEAVSAAGLVGGGRRWCGYTELAKVSSLRRIVGLCNVAMAAAVAAGTTAEERLVVRLMALSPSELREFKKG